MYLLEIGFVQSTADPCLYILNAGKVILLVYVDDILFTGTDEDQVSTTIEQLKERFDTVDLGDARFLLGMAIQRNVDAGTILLTQEAYAKAVLDKFGMVNARPRRHRPSRARSASRRKRFCRQGTPSFSSLPQVLSFTLAGARGRTSLTR